MTELIYCPVRIGVLPIYQLQGVGAALLEAVVRQAKRLNLRSIQADLEANSNLPDYFNTTDKTLSILWLQDG